MTLPRLHDETVVSGTPSCFDTAVTPPSLMMMSCAVIGRSYDKRNNDAIEITKRDVEDCYDSVHSSRVLDTEELLALLDSKGIKNVQIAKALGLPDSRAAEIRSRKRAIKLDEAAKLVRAFQLEEARQVPPVPLPIFRLVIRDLAHQLHVRPSEEQVEALADELRAFASFLSDRRVRQSIEAAEGFFQALRFRRQGAEEEAPQGTDPHPAR
jgi:antitoxin component HigA of HigAB toxin-antitoxin module